MNDATSTPEQIAADPMTDAPEITWEAYCDLEGTIPAKNGDKVALLRDVRGGDLIQENPLLRPTRGDGFVRFDGSCSLQSKRNDKTKETT